MKVSLPAQTILLPSPVLIVGTYGQDGSPNIMNAAECKKSSLPANPLDFKPVKN
jgi:hypothetical protein